MRTCVLCPLPRTHIKSQLWWHVLVNTSTRETETGSLGLTGQTTPDPSDLCFWDRSHTLSQINKDDLKKEIPKANLWSPYVPIHTGISHTHKHAHTLCTKVYMHKSSHAHTSEHTTIWHRRRKVSKVEQELATHASRPSESGISYLHICSWKRAWHFWLSVQPDQHHSLKC